MKTIRVSAMRIFAIASALALACALTACGGNASSSASASSSGADASAASSQASGSDEAALMDVVMGNGLVSNFVGDNVTDAKVTNQEEAQTVADSLIERMGGDSTTDLALIHVIPTETGTTYYIFQQEAGGVMVYGASAKLIVNSDGKVVGLVSAILPDVKVPSLESTGVTQEQAEQTVVEALAENGMPNAKVASDYTAMTIIPLPNMQQRYCLAWVVYVPSPSNDGDDQGWLASYVGADGTYLNSIPVSEPNGADALRGQSTGFDFNAYDQQDKSFEVVKAGENTQVTVPVLIDKQSGEVAFLGDAKRQILCVDYDEATQNDKLASPAGENGSFDDKDIAVYENFIRVYDYYAEIGWPGPNGQNAPSLLMMNYTENGEPAENCVYTGFSSGWETFAFGRVNDYGLATDVIAHEFTHCVTSTTMTTNLYANEPGAINEGMSDIMGNLVEMALDGDEGAWIMGEKAKAGGMRSMSDPPVHYQPGYRWDVYYTPDAPEVSSMNDRGGVHGNSSMLNIVSYKLGKAGMPVEDQVYYWMNVALAMVPTSDFTQMAQLLPWVLNQSGYSQYADALNQAIDEARYTKLEQPAELPEGAGGVTFTFPDNKAAAQGNVRVMFYDGPSIDKGSTDIWSWPVAQSDVVKETLPAGDYYAVTLIGEEPTTATCKIYNGDGWVDFDIANEAIRDKGALIHVEAGKTVELSASGLA